MLPPVFYLPTESMLEGIVALPAEEGRHALSVLRLGRNDLILAVDGDGIAYRGEILDTKKPSKVTFRITSTVRNLGEPSVRLTLAAGLSTGFKFDQVIQQGTEVGISRFVPLKTEKSQIKSSDLTTKLRRFEKVAVAAMKQSRRSFLPAIAGIRTLPEFLRESADEPLKLLFHPTEGTGYSFEQIAKESVQRAAILVGPESGFSENEVELALKAGFKPVSLGERVLRTETAGPVCAALVLLALGEFK